MKSSLVTALSLVGVIGAGSAAALVNTSIFDSTPDAAEAAFVTGATVVELTLPAVADAAPANLSLKEATTTTVAPTPTTTAPLPEQPSLLTRYDIGEAGSVTVDVVNGKIALVDTTVGAGWILVSSAVNSGTNSVNVQFTDDQVNVFFTATFAEGRITPSIRSEEVPAGSGYDDDHDGDDHEYDEHDDHDENDDHEYDEHDDHDEDDD